MNLFINYTGGLGFLNFWSTFPGVGGIASSRQLLDAAMEFQAAKDFDKARILHPIHWCWWHSYVAQHVVNLVEVDSIIRLSIVLVQH